MKENATQTTERRIKGIYRFGYMIVAPVMALVTRRHWAGFENVPQTGGFILAPNHMSNFDPINMGYFMATHGFETRFLAKESIFRVPVIGPFMRKWGMVPVVRQSAEATDSLIHAREALEQGDAVGIYLEGTLTRDPAFWPMKGKTGAARLALDTGVPIIPVVQWGPQNVLDRYSPRFRLRKTNIYVRVLPALDLSDITGDSSDHEAVREVTKRLQGALAEGLGNLRGQVPPGQPWDMVAAGGPGKEELKRLAKWRRRLAKINHRQEILPVQPDLTRG